MSDLVEKVILNHKEKFAIYCMETENYSLEDEYMFSEIRNCADFILTMVAPSMFEYSTREEMEAYIKGHFPREEHCYNYVKDEVIPMVLFFKNCEEK